MRETVVDALIMYTSRTGFTRIREHIADYRAASAANLPPLQSDDNSVFRKRVKSWMWEHTRDVHGGTVGEHGGVKDFKFSVSGKFRKCLDRQVDEGLRIQRREREGCVLLNSKNEFYTKNSGARFQAVLKKERK